ncbi:glutaredoxin [Vibrio phage 2.275.O._10N.286.54.E11]|nr:glutaredoxin [Vibrio phage 2.275.O._10N.286.54.E11]
MDIVLFSKTECTYCLIAEDNLKRKNLPYKKLILEEDYSPNELKDITGKDIDDIVFPVSVVDGETIIGAKDLHFHIRKMVRANKTK